MKTLVLKNNFQMNMTMLPNSFVDHYMANANGEFVKVYLFLLRHVEDAASSLSISMIADYLNNTENDVLRAFRYWESVGLLRLGHGPDGGITAVEFLRDEEENTCGDTTDFSGCTSSYPQDSIPAQTLVAPVTEAGAAERSVYLPAGTVWKDCSTGTVYKGGQRVTVPAPIDVIPVFVRGNEDIEVY